MSTERERVWVRRAHAASRSLEERALRRIPGGVNSAVRLDAPAIFFVRGQGAWLWDVDGNDYVDYLLGQGPAFLGHAPEAVVAAVEEASRGGIVFGSRHRLEVEAAELMCEMLGWPDMVRFGSTGTEMIQAALRLARAATGRRRFVRFEGHYHGWLDNVLAAIADGRSVPASEGQLPEHLTDSITLPWNDAAVLRRILEQDGADVAAVLMEPMMLNAGAILPRPGYLEEVRALCDRYGALLVFDEVITGFRIDPGGAAARFGALPHLAVYGKALGSGWPVAAIAGPAGLMELFARRVNHSGTFNGNVVAMAATVATLRCLKDDPPYGRIDRLGVRLMEGLRDTSRGRVALRIQGLPVAFHASLGDVAAEVTDYRGLLSLDLEGYQELAGHLVDSGVWVAPRGIWYLSAAHAQREVDVALERVDAALARV